MVKRCLISCMFLLVINKVSSEIIEAVEGDNIILPCIYSGDVPKSKEINVFWSYNDRRLCSIFKGKVSITGQDPEYKGRTEIYPEEYAQGNFSIKLSNVKASDEGKYICSLDFVEVDKLVDLKVRAPQPTLQPAPQPTRSRDNGVESRSAKILFIFTALLGYYQVFL